MAQPVPEGAIKVQGNKWYMPVAYRIKAYREDHPKGKIISRPLEIDYEKQWAVFEATVYDNDGNELATAHKMENKAGFGDWLEKAQTGSIGRALAYCGYGTLDAFENEQEKGRIVDSPQPAPTKQEKGTPAPKPTDVDEWRVKYEAKCAELKVSPKDCWLWLKTGIADLTFRAAIQRVPSYVQYLKDEAKNRELADQPAPEDETPMIDDSEGV